MIKRLFTKKYGESQFQLFTERDNLHVTDHVWGKKGENGNVTVILYYKNNYVLLHVKSKNNIADYLLERAYFRQQRDNSEENYELVISKLREEKGIVRIRDVQNEIGGSLSIIHKYMRKYGYLN